MVIILTLGVVMAALLGAAVVTVFLASRSMKRTADKVESAARRTLISRIREDEAADDFAEWEGEFDYA